MSVATVKTSKNKALRFLAACMLALEQIYRVNPPEKERKTLIDKKDKKKSTKKHP